MWEAEEQELAISLLRQALQNGRLHHSYLLMGPPHVGKTIMARNLAQAVNCTSADIPCGSCTSCHRISTGHHADVQVIGLESRDGKPARAEIGIDQIRDIQHYASLRPYEGKNRVFIIDGAEHFSEEAANCLLKTLEEPPSDVLLILLTSAPESLPSTILSRCQCIEVRPLPISKVSSILQKRYGMEEPMSREVARLSRGCLQWAVQCARDPEVFQQYETELRAIIKLMNSTFADRFEYAQELAGEFQRNRALARDRLSIWLRWWRDILLAKEGLLDHVAHLSRQNHLAEFAERYTIKDITDFLSGVFSTLQALDNNASPRVAMDALMLMLPKVANMPATTLQSTG